MRTLAALGTLLLALIALSATVSAEPPPAYRVIVHPHNAVSGADRNFLQDVFLRRVKRWPNDKVIHPADLAPSSRVRKRFTEDVLGRSIAAVKAYWQQRIFSGRDVPPPEFESDEQVVAYVLKYEGAVGYVSENAALRGAKVLGVGR